jgi:hypothetical protein
MDCIVSASDIRDMASREIYSFNLGKGWEVKQMATD